MKLEDYSFHAVLRSDHTFESFLHGNSDCHVNCVPVFSTDPPTITESKSNEATTGRKASLKCEASAVPAPDFEWYRDDTRYVPNALCPHCSTRWSSGQNQALLQLCGFIQLNSLFSKFFIKYFGALVLNPKPQSIQVTCKEGGKGLHG